MEKMIRVFPRRTKWTPDDDLAFYDPPGLFRPKDDWPIRVSVRISVCFTWDIPRGQQLFDAWKRFYKNIQIGGPAFDDRGGLFVPGQFIKNGVTITSRGCPRRCPWCFVWGREGDIRELPICRGHIVQDNNLLATGDQHQLKVLEMLKSETQPIKYSGGLDPRLWRSKHRAFLEDVKLAEAWFACDSAKLLPRLERVRKSIKSINRRKLRCYVLVGFNGESRFDAERRVRNVYDLGMDPFAQFYRGPGEQDKTPEWVSFCRIWSRPAIYRTLMEGAK